jgi:hypothetical protein
MNKKISITVVLTIAAVLTAYISALTLSNQAFAQPVNPLYPPRDEVIWAKTFESEEAQAGKILAGHCQEADGRQCLEPIPTIR